MVLLMFTACNPTTELEASDISVASIRVAEVTSATKILVSDGTLKMSAVVRPVDVKNIIW